MGRNLKKEKEIQLKLLLYFITDIRRYEEAAKVTVSKNVHHTHLQRGKEFKNVHLCKWAWTSCFNVKSEHMDYVLYAAEGEAAC